MRWESVRERGKRGRKDLCKGGDVCVRGEGRSVLESGEMCLG